MIGKPDGSINDLEAAKLLLDSWKFRQVHCWTSLRTYVFAATVVSVVPYILMFQYAEQAAHLKPIFLIFPTLGFCIAISAVWLYYAEYLRAQWMNSVLRQLLQDHGYDKRLDISLVCGGLFNWSIGKATAMALAIFSVILFLINLVLIMFLL